MRPPATAQSMIASGILRLGSRVSSESVEIASNPKKDSARTAAPAATAPKSMPDSMNGAVND
jgi:hypothetical protein